jgi:hypothetical protein
MMEKNEQVEEYLSIKLNKKLNNEKANVKSYEEEDYNFSLFDEKTNNNNISDNSPSSKTKKNMLDLDEQNLHEFLNYDLINSLNNDNQIDSNKYSDHSNSSIKDYTSITSDKNLNHSSDNYNDCTGEENLKNDDNLNQINSNKFTNSNLNNEDINNNNTKNIIINDIKLLNDPLLAPLFIPKKLRDKLVVKNEKEKKHYNNTKKELTIGLINKFDDNIDNDYVKELMINMVNKIKKKIHFEIRTGDWMCLWCRNLNFAYRIRCNRCGLLKKSTSFLYINNNYRKNLNFKNKCLNNNNYKKEELINAVSDNKKIFEI